MDSRLREMFNSNLQLQPDYVSDVLGLEGETARKVGQISGGIHVEEVEILSQVVREVDPVNSIEVGLGYGFSALTICVSGERPIAERRHTVIDPHQSNYWSSKGIERLRQEGFADMVTLCEEPSYRVLSRLEQEGEAIDFAFVDGWHTFDYVFVDFFLIDKLLRPGGVVMFDDADWASIRPVLRYAVTNLDYTVVATLPEKGERQPMDVELGLEGSCIALRKPASAVSREIFFHRPFLDGNGFNKEND